MLYKEGFYGAGSGPEGAQARSHAVRESIRRVLADTNFVSIARTFVDRPAEPSRVAGEAVIEWSRPIPTEGELIRITPSARQPVMPGSVVERVSSAVWTLEGPERSGTAFLITADGLALTNNHVFENQASISAGLPDGTRVPARVLRTDPAGDVARTDHFWATMSTRRCCSPLKTRTGV